jgi:hypothetical protein
LATSGMSCTPVDPVPMTAARRPLNEKLSSQVAAWMMRPLNVSIPGMRGAWLTQEARRGDEELRAQRLTTGQRDQPDPGIIVPAVTLPRWC